jgi:sugar phosphate isomerase/epimerase
MQNNSDIRLGTTVYSLTNEFHAREYTFEGLVREIAARDLGPGLEVVGYQSIRSFPNVDDAYVSWFRNLLDECELEPSCLGLNADVAIQRDRSLTLDEAVELQRLQLVSAAKLGFPVARVQGYILGPEAYERLLPTAEKLNVKMGVEVHAPHHLNDPKIVEYREAFDRLDSPYLGFIPDFSTSAYAVPPSYIQFLRWNEVPEDLIAEALAVWGDVANDWNARVAFIQRLRRGTTPANQISAVGRMFGMFGRQPVREWLEMMDRVVHVHGKFYDIDASGEETSIPFRELLPLFRDAGYKGYISSEWEGHVFSDEGGFDLLVKQQKLSASILNNLA